MFSAYRNKAQQEKGKHCGSKSLMNLYLWINNLLMLKIKVVEKERGRVERTHFHPCDLQQLLS